MLPHFIIKPKEKQSTNIYYKSEMSNFCTWKVFWIGFFSFCCIAIAVCCSCHACNLLPHFVCCFAFILFLFVAFCFHQYKSSSGSRQLIIKFKKAAFVADTITTITETKNEEWLTKADAYSTKNGGANFPFCSGSHASPETEAIKQITYIKKYEEYFGALHFSLFTSLAPLSPKQWHIAHLL